MKKTAGMILVFCMLIGIGFRLNQVTLNRTSQGCIQLTDFYELEDHTVDALFVGSSHIYYSINTCMLYDNYGVAGYLLASPGQPVWISYYLLEEALKTQSPKLVVFDVCTLYRTEKDVGTASLPSLISMKPSLTKWNAIRAVNQEGNLLDAVGAFFSFPYYHTRYTELTRQDYENTKRVRYNGFKADFKVISSHALSEWEGADEKFKDFDQIKPVSARTETYLRKLIELCQNRGLPILLVNSPYVNKTEEKQMAYNYIRLIAQEYEIPFIDANYRKEIKINYAEDMRDPSHLNYFGSMKYTDFLAGFIKKNYELPDRRGSSRYRNWEEVSNKLLHMKLYEKKLHKIKNQEDYLNALGELEECIIVTCQTPNGGAAVYDNGQAVFTAKKGQEYFRHFDLGSSDLAVAGSKGQIRVLLDKKEYLSASPGLGILVYDKVAKKVIDEAVFDGNHEVIRKAKM